MFSNTPRTTQLRPPQDAGARVQDAGGEQLHQSVLQLREGVLRGVRQGEDTPGSLQHVVRDV